MLQFIQFLLEYPISYFEDLPDATPPKAVEAAAERFGLSDHIKWKWLKNKQFTHSCELDTGTPDGIITMRPEDIRENWFHELGHEVFDHSDKDSIKPLLDRIKVECRPSHEWLKQQTGAHYKWIQLGEWKYTYSHSGKQYEYDELFAITFAFVVDDHGKFKDADVQKDYDAMLERLSKRS